MHVHDMLKTQLVEQVPWDDIFPAHYWKQLRYRSANSEPPFNLRGRLAKPIEGAAEPEIDYLQISLSSPNASHLRRSALIKDK